MGCEVCCGYAGGLRRNPSGCPCCSGGRETCEGAAAFCDGCSLCEETTGRTRRVIARAPRSEAGRKRRARNGIKPGDLIWVTRGFYFQKGGGPRLRYFTREARVNRAPKT